jgi:hypothetical protein
MTDVIDSTAVEEHNDDVGTTVATIDTQALAIIRADEPQDVLIKATKIADALKGLIESQGLSVNVGGRKPHVEVGAWQALGWLLGSLGGQPLHAETVWSRILRHPDGTPVKHADDQQGHDWEARVEIKTLTGSVVGAAEAMCSRTEGTWARRPDPALKSMAETRAESRAYRRAAGWIVNIAGYNPTPAEEMPPEQAAAAGLPYGPEADENTAKQAGPALTQLLGDAQAAKAAWGDVKRACGGYMPQAVAVAIRVLANPTHDQDFRPAGTRA